MYKVILSIFFLAVASAVLLSSSIALPQEMQEFSSNDISPRVEVVITYSCNDLEYGHDRWCGHRFLDLKNPQDVSRFDTACTYTDSKQMIYPYQIS